jgi:thiol-disulfide isomerase/thioredoxin
VTVGGRIALAIAIAVACGAGGFLAYNHLGPEHASLTPIPEGEPAPVPPPEVAAAAEEAPAEQPVADMVPDVSLADRAGVQRKLSDWKGQPVLINFWATWCAPCRKEIPLLKELRQTRKADRFEVIGIAVDERDAVLKYAQEIGIDYPILIGEADGMKAANAFGVPLVFPFSVFADRQGRIVTVKIGELHKDEAEFILDRVRELDGGKAQLPAVQEQISTKLAELAAERARKVDPKHADKGANPA